MMTHISPSYFSNSASTQPAGNAFKTKMEPTNYSQASRLSLGIIPPATDVFFSGKAQQASAKAEAASKQSVMGGLRSLFAGK